MIKALISLRGGWLIKRREFVYPGSFDPLTKGHVNVVSRAAQLCDILHVVILTNPAKQPAFTVEQRMEMAKLCLSKWDNIRVDSYRGLLVDYMREQSIHVVVRGLRSESDFRFETEMAATNALMYPDYETILLPSKTDYSFTSSSMVREIASYGGDISKMVPPEILPMVEECFKQ